MKRISFFLVILCALALSLGSTAFAQNGVLSIMKVDGLYNNDTVMNGAAVRFYIRANNNTGQLLDISNGWKINDGGTGTSWGSTAIRESNPTHFSGWYGSNFGIGTYSADGLLADTAGYFGAGGGTGPGDTKMPVGFNDTIVVITAAFGAINPANEGKQICIDSSFFPPSLNWEWLDPLFNSMKPTWTSTFGDDSVAVGKGFCFTIYTVPNLCPNVVDPPVVGITVSHCGPFDYTFTATDNEGDPATFSFDAPSVGGLSAPTATSVHWSAATLAPGAYVISVHAADGICGGFGHTGLLNVVSTNDLPVIATGCNDFRNIGVGVDGTIPMTATDADACDVPGLVWSTPTVGASMVGSTVHFSSAVVGSFPVTVIVCDPVGGCDTCQVSFNVSAGADVRIEKTHGTLQGTFERVDVVINTLPSGGDLGGFDLLIGYDNSALSLQSVDVNSSQLYGPIPDCGWESFTYRFGANGNCSGGCPSGLVRVVGIAETNNGANHPNIPVPCTFGAHAGDTLFSMNFLVSNDRTLECQYVPIRFFWIDCGDNTLSSLDGTKLYIENSVFDYGGLPGDPDYPWTMISPGYATFPGFAGVPAGFCLGELNKPAPIREIKFYNGGIDIICADTIDARGDINLNNVAYEIADAVMFSNYFVKGMAALVFIPPNGFAGSIAASDVNADGLTLTVADLVYLIRVIVGDALPYAKLSPVAMNYTTDNGMISVQGELGAAAVVVAGNVTSTLLATNMAIMSEFDGKNTRILVYPPISDGMTSMETFSGNFLAVNGNILSVDLSTPDGAPVVAKVVPTAYSLSQNYPNPFNPSTTIAFALPKASNYTLTIYNVTGQKVWETSGSGEAGSHSVVWEASRNASGIYFYKLEAGSFSATKKMALLK